MDTRSLGSNAGLVAGRYRIEAQAGSGGVALVYRAVDTRLGRTVALKKLREESRRTPTFEERFEREARLASAVRHPGCAQLLDFGWDESGAPFLVAEWIEGSCLFDEVTKNGPMAPLRAANLFGQLCEALAAVHRAGVVHRDIKPENVMLLREADGRESVKLVDFGIARSLAKDAPALTLANMRIGSPEYMSPEHILGESCDERADIYCAAALFCFLLTGRAPFAGTAQAVLTHHLSSPPPALPAALARFQAVIDRGLAKKNEERFQSALELKAAANDAVAPARRAKPARLITAVVVLALLVLGVGAAATNAFANQKGPTSPPARLSWAEAESRGRQEAVAKGYKVHASEVRGGKDGFQVELQVTNGGGKEALVAIVDPVTGDCELKKLSSQR